MRLSIQFNNIAYRARHGLVGTWPQLLLWLALLLLGPSPALCQSVAQQAEAGAPAVLRIANRDVTTFRAPLGGSTPAQRALAVAERAQGLPASALDKPVSVKESAIGNQRALVVLVGTTPMFALLQSDLDPLSDPSLPEAAAAAANNFSSALKAMRAQQQPQILLLGAGLSLAATVGFGIVGWAILHLNKRLSNALGRATSRPLAWLVVRGVDISVPAMAFLQRFTRLVLWILVFVAAYLWLTFVLRRFPYTEPWGDALAANLLGMLKTLGWNAFSAAPGVLVVILIFTVTQVLTQLFSGFLRAVEQKRVSVPFIYPDTAGATRWLLTALAWMLALVIAYPYIPGSDSVAFKGLSVLAGLMATLGSAGIVNQMMSGLVLVYSRALEKGDVVQIGSTEGVVTGVGPLSTKLETYRNEEFTIPNAVVVGSQIKNYSRLAQTKAATIATTVSIGYDAPWRQVAALLIEAAKRTDGVRHGKPPRVLQRELADFYVKYELVADIDPMHSRAVVLNSLHENILDLFNEHGVQIMSPNFESQPEQKVFVPKDHWFVPPATQGRQQDKS